MKKQTVSLILASIVILFSCGGAMENSSEGRSEMKTSYDEELVEGSAMADTSSYESDPNTMTSSAAVENKKDSLRKFIRTADIKFKVKNVVTSTYAIEDIVTGHDGFVTYTDLSSQILKVEVTPISADSSLETTHFNVINSITLRIPNTKLDTTLKDISKHVDFLDYRIIKAEDIHLSLLSNKLKQKRAEGNEELLKDKIENEEKPSDYTTDKMISSQEQADEAKIAQLYLMDQVNYSTVTMYIYQRESIKREVIPNTDNIEAYEPSFGNKLMSSLSMGLEIIKALILFLVSIWPIVILSLIGWVMYKKYTKK
jgi:hypothetical protein